MKAPLLLTVISYGLYRLCWFLTDAQYLSLLVFLIPVFFLLVNLVLRRHLKYKNWFTSPKNIFLEREHKEFHSNIDAELLFEKIKSVVVDSDLQLLDENADTFSLLAGTSVNFLTWGENIYIVIEPERQLVTVTSVTIFGSHSWNRNRSNYDSFYHSFEESLTI